MNEPCVIGLTGQSGAGKTTVSMIFAEKGFSVINADMISRKVTEKGSPCLFKLKEAFGEDIIFPDGSLDRKKLGSIVFSDKSKLEKLDNICYPYINREIESEINNLSEKGEKMILLDAPTLFEAGADKLCRLIISVTAEEKIREMRITKRDNITPQAARKRFASQLSEDFFAAHSDYRVTNNSSPESLAKAAGDIAEEIKEKINDGF